MDYKQTRKIKSCRFSFLYVPLHGEFKNAQQIFNEQIAKNRKTKAPTHQGALWKTQKGHK
jgi:hypothetical protein